MSGAAKGVRGAETRSLAVGQGTLISREDDLSACVRVFAFLCVGLVHSSLLIRTHHVKISTKTETVNDKIESQGRKIFGKSTARP